MRSKVFHDRLVPPIDTAVYWIEYVARHGGAPHLRVAALDLPWYKYHLLDVIGFISLIVLIIVICVTYIVKRIASKFYYNKKDKKLKKQ